MGIALVLTGIVISSGHVKAELTL